MFFKSNLDSNKEKEILKALSEVQDPDLGKDIVSLGFVKDLVQKGDTVSFKVELTTPACPVKEQLKSQCIEKVRAIPGIAKVEVEMTAAVRHNTSQENRISLPNIKNVIAIASGKGGVGKSTVTVNLTAALAQTGAKVGLLDADIYGPSIPMMFGIREKPMTSPDNKLIPIYRDNIKIISMGLLVSESQPIVWRGPMVHSALTQFMMQVEWGELDYLLIDMPPGTGDAQLTISQNAPLAGAVIVTTPQEISLLDARRGLKMFQSVKVPVLGVIENMAGFKIPGSQEMVPIFRQGGGKKIAQELAVPFLGSVPIEPLIAESGDAGIPLVWSNPESESTPIFQKIAGNIAAQLSVLQMQSQTGFKPLNLQWT